MAKKEETAGTERPIEEFMTDKGIHEAVMLRKGWAPGKCVTAEEYKKAVAEYLAAPAGSYRGRKK